MTTDRNDSVTDIQDARAMRQAVNVHDTRDIREALIGQLLADIDKLLTRQEALISYMSQYEERTQKWEKKAAALFTSEATKVSREMTKVLDERFRDVYRSANGIAHKAEKAALLIDRSAWRLYVMSLVGGVVGGLLSVIGYIVIVSFVL